MKKDPFFQKASKKKCSCASREMFYKNKPEKKFMLICAW